MRLVSIAGGCNRPYPLYIWGVYKKASTMYEACVISTHCVCAAFKRGDDNYHIPASYSLYYYMHVHVTT